jgi:hypothetical protein
MTTGYSIPVRGERQRRCGVETHVACAKRLDAAVGGAAAVPPAQTCRPWHRECGTP